MRISELSRQSLVPVATIKYYLRERLLHEGELTSATQAHYDDSHLARLRLIRALLGPGGLSIATAKTVLGEIDHPRNSTLEMLGAVQHALGNERAESPQPQALALMAQLGWQIDPSDDATLGLLEGALAGLEAADFVVPPELIEVYVEAMHTIAQREIDLAPTDSAEAAIRYTVLGTILIEPLLLGLRRLAHQDATWRRFSPESPCDSEAGRD